MHPKRLARFVQKWFAEWESSPAVFGRATELLAHLIETRPDDAWERILALVAHAKNEVSLSYVGAGPLEDLLSEHGRVIIARVESTVATNPRFVACLARVWGGSRMEPSVYARVQELLNKSSYEAPKA